MKRSIPAMIVAVVSTEGSAQPELPRVVILSTGGTIASQFDADRGGLVPALSGAAMVAAVPELRDIAASRPSRLPTSEAPT